jgi:hypothetical protein
VSNASNSTEEKSTKKDKTEPKPKKEAEESLA